MITEDTERDILFQSIIAKNGFLQGKRPQYLIFI